MDEISLAFQIQTMVVLLKSLRHIGRQHEAEKLLSHFVKTAPLIGVDSLASAAKNELEEAAFGECLGTYADAKCFPVALPNVPKIAHGVNKEVSGLSSAVSMKFEADGRGRRLIANKDVNVGECNGLIALKGPQVIKTS